VSLTKRLYAALGLIATVFLTAAIWEIHAYENARRQVLQALPQDQQLIHVSNQLVVTLIASVFIDFLLLALATYFVRKWIMKPLGSIRGVMQRVAAGEFTKEIWPVGPKEIAEVAVAAEEMRSTLIDQIDYSRGAEKSLRDESDQTLVHALRSALEPTVRKADHANYEIDAYSQGATGVISGDWWDVYTSKNSDGSKTKTTFILVDVEGHDPTTGIVALKIKSIVGEQLESGIPIESIMHNVSRILAGVDNKILSALVVEFPENSTEPARWLNAGHPSAHVFSSGAVQQVLDKTGMILAGFNDEWEVREFEWPIGSAVVFASDGLLELRNEAGEEFGQDGLISAVNKAQTSREIVNQIVSRGQKHGSTKSTSHWEHEDITVVAITRQG